MLENTCEAKNEMLEEWLQQGQILLGSEKYEEAIAYFDRVLNEDSMRYDAYLGRGISWANLEKYDKASDDFKKAIKLNKQNPDAYFHMGNISFMQGDIEDGIKMYNQSINLGYKDADLFFHFGLVYEEAEEYSLAIRYYTQAIHKEPLNPIFYVRKSVVQALDGKYNEALETLDDLRSVASDSFEYYHMSALIHTQLGQLDEAEQILTTANEMFPNDVDLLTDRVRLLIIRNDYTNAEKYLMRALANAENDVQRKDVLLLQGRVYAAQEQMDASVKALKQSLAIGVPARSDFEASYLLINIFQVQKKYDELVQIADTLSSNDMTKEANSFLLSGPYYAALGRKLRGDSDYEEYYKKAIRAYRRLAVDNPERIDAYLFRAISYKDIGMYDRAIEMIDFILSFQPNNGPLHIIKSEIYRLMGDTANAQKERSKAKDGDSVDILNTILGDLNG